MEVYRSLGEWYYGQGRYAEAEAPLKKALKQEGSAYLKGMAASLLGAGAAAGGLFGGGAVVRFVHRISPAVRAGLVEPATCGKGAGKSGERTSGREKSDGVATRRLTLMAVNEETIG